MRSTFAVSALTLLFSAAETSTSQRTNEGCGTNKSVLERLAAADEFSKQERGIDQDSIMIHRPTASIPGE
jgi:hypothetical protein